MSCSPCPLQRRSRSSSNHSSLITRVQRWGPRITSHPPRFFLLSAHPSGRQTSLRGGEVILSQICQRRHSTTQVSRRPLMVSAWHDRRNFSLSAKFRTFKLGKEVLLASYSWGGNSRRLQGMSDEDIVEECVEAVAKVHGKDKMDVKRELIRGVVKNWGEDPYSQGAFVFAKPHHVRRTDSSLMKEW